MGKLEESSLFKRLVRKDPVNEIGISTFAKLEEAIKGSKKEEALDLCGYLLWEGKRLHDGFCDWIYSLLTYIADQFGEEELYKTLRFNAKEWKSVVDLIPLVTVEEFVQFNAETVRTHRCGPGEKGNFTVTEEPDRFIMSFDPCGAGGRMRRVGQLDKSPPRTEPPFNFGKTKKAYPWSWGKKGVLYYCLHCCVMSEIMPIEWVGFPVRVCEYPDNPADPCAWIFYKEPQLIPEKYYTRVGKKKDVKKIKIVWKKN
jgi:hypothetical protein